MFPPSPSLPAADLAHCAATIRAASKSFHAASRLLPRQVRCPALALYAFCRAADDAVDLGAERGRSPERLRARLGRIYEGCPEDRPEDRALAWVAARFALPRALPEALIEGFDWDVAGRRYADLGALTAYAARVAATVGAMMAVLMGARTRGQLARACDLGVAMQFTNIARDVGEDARAGRLYLPLDWLAAEGVNPDAFLADPAPSPAIRRVTARLLAEADALYRRADAGIAALPAGCRPAIYAARHIYAAIGREIARAGHDSVTRRAATGTGRKLSLAALAALRAPLGRRAGDGLPPLPECAFLVEAAAAPPPRRLRERTIFMIEAFTEMNRRDREGGRPILPA